MPIHLGRRDLFSVYSPYAGKLHDCNRVPDHLLVPQFRWRPQTFVVSIYGNSCDVSRLLSARLTILDLARIPIYPFHLNKKSINEV